MEDKREEYARNLMKMKQCNKIYNGGSIAYFGIFGFIMAETFAGSALVLAGGGLFSVSLACAVVIVLGFLGAYKKNNIFALAAPAVVLLMTIIGVLSLPLFIVSAVIGGLTVMANKQYKWLSEQEGFPMFSYHLKEYDERKARNEIKSEYEVQYENYKSHSRDDMEVLPDTGDEVMQQKEENRNNYMDEL